MDELLLETAVEMGGRGPRAEVVEIAGRGHAPEQVILIRDWLGTA